MPRFQAFFAALGFSRFDGESRPTHLPLTRAVRRTKPIGRFVVTGSVLRLKMEAAMIQTIILVVVAAIVLFGILLKLSITPRFAYSRAYVLPLICCGIFFGWMIFSFFFWGQDSRSNYRNLPQDLFMMVAMLVIGVTALVLAGINGALLHVGSRLWIEKQLLTSKFFIAVSLVLWITLTGSTFYLFGLLSWFPTVSP